MNDLLMLRKPDLDKKNEGHRLTPRNESGIHQNHMFSKKKKKKKVKLKVDWYLKLPELI